jgi:hypothetical protein
VFGPDAAQVQAALLAAAGLLIQASPAPLSRPSVAEAGLGAWAYLHPKLKQVRGRLDTSFASDLLLLEHLLDKDVPSALNKARFIAEKALLQLSVEKSTPWKGEASIETMKGPLVFRGHIPKHIAIHLETLQRNANPGSHYQEVPMSVTHLVVAVTALVEFLEWFAGGR